MVYVGIKYAGVYPLSYFCTVFNSSKDIWYVPYKQMDYI